MTATGRPVRAKTIFPTLALVLVLETASAGPAIAAPPDISPALDHVCIQASDLARSIDFYTGVFGLKEVPAPFPKTQARWVAFANGQLLHAVAHGRTGSTHNRWDHFALAFTDITPVIARLDAMDVAGADMSGGRLPQKRPDGLTQIFVQDPDGYQIELNDAGARR